MRLCVEKKKLMCMWTKVQQSSHISEGRLLRRPDSILQMVTLGDPANTFLVFVFSVCILDIFRFVHTETISIPSYFFTLDQHMFIR